MHGETWKLKAGEKTMFRGHIIDSVPETWGWVLCLTQTNNSSVNAVNTSKYHVPKWHWREQATQKVWNGESLQLLRLYSAAGTVNNLHMF